MRQMDTNSKAVGVHLTLLSVGGENRSGHVVRDRGNAKGLWQKREFGSAENVTSHDEETHKVYVRYNQETIRNVENFKSFRIQGQKADTNLYCGDLLEAWMTTTNVFDDKEPDEFK